MCKGQQVSLAKESDADMNAVAPLVAQMLKLKAKLDPEAAAPQEEKKQRTNSDLSSNQSISKNIARVETTANKQQLIIVI